MTVIAMIGITAKRFIMTMMGIVLLGVTFEAVRRRALRERYAILWVLSGVVVLVSAACPSLPELVARALGITFIEGASYLFAFFLVMVVFHISTAISRIRADLEAEARRSALLQAEVERLAKLNEECRMQNAECRMQNAECGIPPTNDAAHGGRLVEPSLPEAAAPLATSASEPSNRQTVKPPNPFTTSPSHHLTTSPFSPP